MAFEFHAGELGAALRASPISPSEPIDRAGADHAVNTCAPSTPTSQRDRAAPPARASAVQQMTRGSPRPRSWGERRIANRATRRRRAPGMSERARTSTREI